MSIFLLILTLASALLVTVLWHRRTRSSAIAGRWADRSRRRAGMASTLDIFRVGSAMAMRRKARVVRPSLTEHGFWTRLRTPAREFAVPLVRVGIQRVWASLEEVTVITGGPRTGKSQWLGGRIIEAPGAAVVTSSRTDLYSWTRSLRASKGPVYVFNAAGLGDMASTIGFDPLTGCDDPVIAAERAHDLIGAGSNAGAGDREFWEGQARRVLAAMLHAAALGGHTMRDVLGWVADPDTAQRIVVSLLRRSAEPAYVADASQFFTTNERTRSSITSTIMPALSWLSSPSARAAASGDTPFDVEALLRARGTVYLLGAEEAHVAPLVCALTGYIAREARRLAARAPSGRLDPPLSLLLDEAALICPVPLASWTSDMGGRGVCIIVALQSRAQLIARYGTTEAAVILNNATAVCLLGGTKDRDDLEYWSALCGQRDEHQHSYDKAGKRTGCTTRKVPVLSPAQLANLPDGRMVVIRRGLLPVVGRFEQARKRRDVRAAVRRAGVEVVEAAEAVTRSRPVHPVPGVDHPEVGR